MKNESESSSFLKHELRSILKTKRHGFISEISLKLRHRSIYNEVVAAWKFNFPSKNFSEKLYWYLEQDDPICVNGNRQKFSSLNVGYVGCNGTLRCPCSELKMRNSMMENHGVAHALQSKQLMAKFTATLKEKHNVDKLHLVNVEQKEATCLARYNARTPLASDVIQEQIKANRKTEIGYEYNFQSPEFQRRIQKQWLDTTGNRTYIPTKEDGKRNQIHLLNRRFPQFAEILLSPELLASELRTQSRQELANKIGCSLPLIEKNIGKYQLTEFQGKPSYYEILIQNFLEANEVEYIKNTRKVIRPKEIDFYMPEHKIGIEFCGLRWHGEKVGRNRDYHLNKLHLAESQCIRLIQIFSDEWDDKSAIVKSILSTQLGKAKRIIHSVETSIEQIDGNTATAFLEKNDIKGRTNDDVINFGLIHNNELVQLITFKIIRRSVILQRTTAKIDVVVTDGAKKLIRYIITKFNPGHVFSYSDPRYFDGEIYNDSGFKYIGRTEPEFYYTKGVKRFNRSDIETQLIGDIRWSHNYDKIWDCGYDGWLLQHNW